MPMHAAANAPTWSITYMEVMEFWHHPWHSLQSYSEIWTNCGDDSFLKICTETSLFVCHFCTLSDCPRVTHGHRLSPACPSHSPPPPSHTFLGWPARMKNYISISQPTRYVQPCGLFIPGSTSFPALNTVSCCCHRRKNPSEAVCLPSLALFSWSKLACNCPHKFPKCHKTSETV